MYRYSCCLRAVGLAPFLVLFRSESFSRFLEISDQLEIKQRLFSSTNRYGNRRAYGRTVSYHVNGHAGGEELSLVKDSPKRTYRVLYTAFRFRGCDEARVASPTLLAADLWMSWDDGFTPVPAAPDSPDRVVWIYRYLLLSVKRTRASNILGTTVARYIDK